MSPALTFDLIVGIVLLAALLLGIRFGFLKVFLIFLAALLPNLIKALLVVIVGSKTFFELETGENAQIVGYLNIAMSVLSLGLIAWIIISWPRSTSVAGRTFGALFAVAQALFLVVIGSLVVSQIADIQDVRTRSVTGPVIFAMGDALKSLLPDNPERMFRKGAAAPDGRGDQPLGIILC